MPQYRASEACQGYIDPSQLYSTFPIVYDQDITSPNAVNSYSGMDDMSISCQGNSFEVNTAQSCERDQFDYCMGPVWPTENRSSTPSASSKSSSPSPDSSTSQPGQSHKRRAQNRAAQRAYRDRKMRYLQDLQSGIKEIEQQISRLQNENTNLIRQLCETRAANNGLRDSSRCSSAKTSRQSSLASSSSSRSDGPAEAWSKANFSGPGNGELQALYEPFAAMWNLIHLDPSVARGSVTAQNVLDRLRTMVEFSAAKLELQPACSFSASAIPT